MNVACFYEWMENIMLLRGADGRYDIVRTEPLPGEDDFTALIAASIGIQSKRNFKRTAADNNTIYYTATLSRPTGVLLTPEEALIYNLSDGLADIVKKIYIRELK